MLNFNIATIAAVVNAPGPTLRLRPRMQDMHNSTYQPVVVYDDGGQGGVICGETLLTPESAYSAARDAIEAALPAGEWDDEGLWYANRAA